MFQRCCQLQHQPFIHFIKEKINYYTEFIVIKQQVKFSVGTSEGKLESNRWHLEFSVDLMI